MRSQLVLNSKSAYLYNQVEFAPITNLLLKFFLSHLQPEWLPCVKNWCGLNDPCAMDPIHPQHHWCLCRIGTDEHGNCVGEQCLIHPGYQRFFLACVGELRFVGRRPTCVRPKAEDRPKLETAHEKPLAPRVCLIYSTIHLFNSGQWLCCCCCCLFFFVCENRELSKLSKLSFDQFLDI